jgi:putative tricarboxylic transport membrane protein
MKSDRISGVVWLVVAIAMGLLATQFHSPFSYEPIGPAKYPMLLALLMGLCGIWFIIRPGAEPQWPDSRLWRKVVIMFALLLAYAWLFQLLGFMLATALLTVGLGRLYDGRWLQCVIGGALLGPGLYVFFDRLLDVALPIGTVWTAV